VAPGPDDRRNDHTRPTIAFIALAVTAAAVMTAGMTSRADTPLAADLPPRITSVAPTPSTATPSPEAMTVPDFSMADVVTLAAAEATRRPAPSKPRRDRADGSAGGPSAAEPGSSGRSSTAGGGDGSRTGGGPGGGSGGQSGAGTPAGSGGSGGSGGGGTADGSGGSTDAGPGRSTTGQGKARGQQDAAPGRGGGATWIARATGRAEAPRTHRATGRR
jgi:hypothetical protein